MNGNQMLITRILNKRQKEEAARILYNAFPLKFSHLWIYSKTESQALQFFKEGLDYKYGIYALLEGNVVGILGLDLGKGKRFIRYSLAAFINTFGWMGGFARYVDYSFERIFIHTKANEYQSRIDPIAVSKDVRGKGVGSMLLSEFEKNSRKLGNKSIVLEVVDPNDGAKKLYIKEGYVAYRYFWTALFTKKAGFNGLHYMKKSLA